MTTVFVDLVNLDGSRPEGSLRFSLERLVLGGPDVVPSAVEARIRDGKARVDGLLPGAMRVRVNAGCWSKDWHITVPAEGEHDLFDLLEWQADDFQETVWAALAARVEKLEQVPPVDLAPLENRVTALEANPAFDPSELQAQLAALQAHFTPVDISLNDDINEDLAPIYDTGTSAGLVQHAGRVSISFRVFDIEGALRALDVLKLPHFPKAAAFADSDTSNCHVELYQGAKFLTKIEPRKIYLGNDSGELGFHMALDEVLAVAQETGATSMYLSTFYYTDALPPETE